MKRTFKVLAWASGAVVLLIGLALAALWFLFDPQAIKTQAGQWVKQHTGRELVIAGDLDLVFFPRIGVAMNRVSLSERDQAHVRFAAIDQVRVGVAVMPLFSGRLEAEEILLAGADVQFVKFADGRMNIDDLAGIAAAGEGAKPKDAPPSPEATASVPAIRLAGLRIDNGRLAFRDDRAGRQIGLADLNLRVGPLADQASGNLDFAAELHEGQHRLRATLTTAYRLQANPLQVRLEGLEATVQGSWSALPSIDAHWAIASAAIDPAQLTLTDSKLRAGLKLAQGGSDLALALPGIRMGLASGARKLTVADYGGDLQVAMPGLPAGKMNVKFSGDAAADLDALSATGSNRLSFDDTNVQASWQLPAFTPLRASFDATIDRLNVDRYLPQPAAKGTESAASPKPAVDAPIGLPIPAGLDLTGKLKIGALQVAGVKIDRADLALRLTGRRLTVSPLRFDLYGGRAAGQLMADATGGQRVSAQLALDGVDLRPLLIDAARTDLLAGRGKVALDVTTGGRTLGAMKAGLAGSASLVLRDGALKGINLARSLREIKSSLSAEPAAQATSSDAQTDFSDISASFRIVRGVARNDDLLARSPFLRLTGAGDIDIAQGHLDYLARVVVVNTSTGQDGKQLEHLRGVTVPLRVQGPFAAPKFRLEVAGLAKEAARARLGEKLGLPAGQEAEAVREGAKAKLKEKLDDRLKGLFGR